MKILLLHQYFLEVDDPAVTAGMKGPKCGLMPGMRSP